MIRPLSGMRPVSPALRFGMNDAKEIAQKLKSTMKVVGPSRTVDRMNRETKVEFDGKTYDVAIHQFGTFTAKGSDATIKFNYDPAEFTYQKDGRTIRSGESSVTNTVLEMAYEIWDAAYTKS